MRTNLLLILVALALVGCPTPPRDDDDDGTDSPPDDDDSALVDDDDVADDDDSALVDDDDAIDDDDVVEPSDAEVALRAHLQLFVDTSFGEDELTFGVTEVDEIGPGSNIGTWSDDVVGTWTVLDVAVVDGTEEAPTGFATLTGDGQSDFRTAQVLPRMVSGATLFEVDWAVATQVATTYAVVAPGAGAPGDQEAFLEPVTTTYRTLGSGDPDEADLSIVDGFGAASGTYSAALECGEGCEGTASADGFDDDPICEADLVFLETCEGEEGCLMVVSYVGVCGRADVVFDDGSGRFDLEEDEFGHIFLDVIVEVTTPCEQCEDLIDLDGDGISVADGDCDEGDPSIYPGAPEICDETDSDCDGSLVDTDTDTDGDLEPDCIDDDDDNDLFPDVVDCGPLDASIYPNATESCDTVDSDCDGSLVDDDVDTDGDLEPDCTDPDDDGDLDPDLTDCAPLDLTAYTGAPESCDGVDNDCDTDIDEDFDLDLDTVTTCAGDCDDNDAANFPGNAEVCDDQDNDCDGALGLDEIDNDGDSFDECDVVPDCDDADPDNFPGNPEVCDGADNDCDGFFSPDEIDNDGDGVTECDVVPDCDDADPDNFPGNTEQCDDQDNDCDGLLGGDEIDDDLDGVDECDIDPDCDDADINNFPGNPEVCDGFDNDCDLFLDPTETDDDGDTFNECVDGDCNDADATIYVGATEVCEDGIDQDCDGNDPSCCQMAVFTTSGSEPNCWCAQNTHTTTVTVAGYASAITANSLSTNVGCNSCPPYTQEVVWFNVGTHTLTSQAVPCTCSPSSLVLVGQLAVTPVCGP